MHHTRHDTHETHTHERMHPKDTLVSISRHVIICTAHATSKRVPLTTPHTREDSRKCHTTQHINTHPNTPALHMQICTTRNATQIRRCSPKDTPHCMSKDVCSVRSWQVSCVCSHSRLHFVLSVVSSLGMSLCVVLNSYSSMSHVWCSYNSHIEYNTQPMCQHNLLTTQPLNTQPLLIHTLLTHNLRPMLRSSGRAAGSFCPEPPRATRSRQAEVLAARPFPTKH